MNQINNSCEQGNCSGEVEAIPENTGKGKLFTIHGMEKSKRNFFSYILNIERSTNGKNGPNEQEDVIYYEILQRNMG